MDAGIITFGDIADAAISTTIDDAASHLQYIMGQTDGGVAGMFFDTLDDDQWRRLDMYARQRKLFAYVQTEYSYQR